MPEHWNEIVKHYRLRHGLSQSEMAKLMNVSQRTISRWERGEDRPGIAYKKRLRDLALEPPEILLRTLTAAVARCPAPRALSRSQNLQLVAVSKPALEKRPSIAQWYGCNLAQIATGVLQEMLDDRELQNSISKREVAGVMTTSRSVLKTPESPHIGAYRTTISYFYHDGTLYSDAVAVPAPSGEVCGYKPYYSDEAGLGFAPTSTDDNELAVISDLR
ncbi:MAG: helix-turn-helix domain-containing protein [Alphaproteobacteria bacterium]|nr:helix-turn-helix domain-containing protein [Alphaproteobacteria bacterium]